ncbi:MAG: hypothetical protein FD177_113 [Desulfovibrionaceae bacterium]|nr:MAG: hypothetical protein FD177_113 [Desulfovibrionaceae bacterium]
MSAIPTVEVTVSVQDNQGQAVPGAAVKALLTAQERYQGLEVPGQVLGVTDVHGKAVLELFPNDLGSEGSSYSLTVTPPLGGSIVRFVAIPNSPCDVLIRPHAQTAITGPQGLQGQKGDKGEKGDKGDRGEQGLQGLPGESAGVAGADLYLANLYPCLNY